MKRIIYFPLSITRWATYHAAVIGNNHPPIKVNLEPQDFLKSPNSIGMIPLYESVEELRKDWPDRSIGIGEIEGTFSHSSTGQFIPKIVNDAPRSPVAAAPNPSVAPARANEPGESDATP